MPSRRTFSVRDPLLTLKSSHILPNIKVSLNNNEIFNQDTFKVKFT